MTRLAPIALVLALLVSCGSATERPSADRAIPEVRAGTTVRVRVPMAAAGLDREAIRAIMKMAGAEVSATDALLDALVDAIGTGYLEVEMVASSVAPEPVITTPDPPAALLGLSPVWWILILAVVGVVALLATGRAQVKELRALLHKDPPSNGDTPTP